MQTLNLNNIDSTLCTRYTENDLREVRNSFSVFEDEKTRLASLNAVFHLPHFFHLNQGIVEYVLLPGLYHQ